MDKIHLNNMMFYGYHGVYPEETKLGQRFYVDVTLIVDLAKAGETDRLADTIDYAQVYTLIQKIMEGSPRQLIEKLATDISNVILSQFPEVYEVTVKITKPDPPIPGHYESISVEITRGQR